MQQSSLLSFEPIGDVSVDVAHDDQIACSLVIVEWKHRALFGFNVARNQWELPGGSVEPGESSREAAIRELAEETGIRSDKLQFVGRAELAVGREALTCVASVFALLLNNPPDLVTSEELNDFRWWGANDETWDGMNTVDAELVRRAVQNQPKLKSDRVPVVVLRQFRPDDALTHLRGEDEAISKWLSGVVSTEESVRRWIQSNEDNWSSDGPRFAFAIETLARELVGVIEINVDHSHFAGLEPGDANVSYGLYPEYRGRGLASSALLRIRDFMISKGVQRAVIRVEPENVDSVRLAERCGYLSSGVVVNGVGIKYLRFIDDLTRAADELSFGHS